MVKTMLKVLFGAALLLVVLSAPAYADTIVVFNTGNGCGGSNCMGNVVTVLIHPTGVGTYTVTLTVDTTGNTANGNAAGTSIVGVALKIGTGGMTAASLTSAPSGAGNWASGLYNGLSQNGCGNTATQGWGCAENTAFVSFASVTQPASDPAPTFPTSLASLPNAGTYVWVWDVTATGNVATSSIEAKVSFAHIATSFSGKNNSTAKYSYNNDGIISSAGFGSDYPPPNNPVPEPGSLMLFGTGLIGLAGILRRRLS